MSDDEPIGRPIHNDDDFGPGYLTGKPSLVVSSGIIGRIAADIIRATCRANGTAPSIWYISRGDFDLLNRDLLGYLPDPLGQIRVLDVPIALDELGPGFGISDVPIGERGFGVR